MIKAALRFSFRNAITNERVGNASLLLEDLAAACAMSLEEVEPGAQLLQVHVTFMGMFSTRFTIALEK